MSMLGFLQRMTHIRVAIVTTTVLIVAMLPLEAGLVEAAKCDTCKDIVKNFNEGIKKTAKSNFGGGNTKWEEKSLGSYTYSETRFVEIVEGVCKDGKECHSLVEEHEETLERWWFKSFAKNKNKDLFTYFCVNKLEICCPNGTYGAECRECRGSRERPCNGNGKCLGEGTREGTGACRCDDGYSGDLCDECKDLYYEEVKNDTHTICRACDSSCKTTCFEDGSKGCDDCKDGWDWVEDEGCIDIDECELDDSCEDDKYCTNMPGSYRCAACDTSCKGCTGAGSRSCIHCADKFFKDGDFCKGCHISCVSSCLDNSAKTCDACREGWSLSDDNECLDIDECQTEAADCDDDEYCINNRGSYKCSTCHYACEGCTGPGTDQCKECHAGYYKRDGDACMDFDECDKEDACEGEHRRCINTPGSYKCDCEIGYVLKDGLCKEKKVKQIKRKKKETKKEKYESSDDEDEDDADKFEPLPNKADVEFPPLPTPDDDDMVTMEGTFNDPTETDAKNHDEL